MSDKSPLISYIMNIIFYIVLSILLLLWLLTIICRRHGSFQSSTQQRRQAVLVSPAIVAYPINQELPPGLESSIIETFPKFAYSRSDQDTGMKMTGECAVCLGVFEEKETLRLLPKCGHVFHAECVDIWLGMHATCPFCRAILLPEQASTVEGPTTQFEVVINVNDGRER
ncbi:E3 ubiquitin-protein ligase ATL9 [Bienertia sinuspersici]